jgi:hypothetical protein
MGTGGRSVKVATYLHLLLTLRMYGRDNHTRNNAGGNKQKEREENGQSE